MELSEDSVVVSTPRLVAADLGEEVVILDMEDGFYFGLGDVGARVWKLLREPVAVSEIERVLLAEYDVEPERCHNEVLRLIADLVERGLVEVQRS